MNIAGHMITAVVCYCNFFFLSGNVYEWSTLTLMRHNDCRMACTIIIVLMVAGSLARFTVSTWLIIIARFWPLTWVPVANNWLIWAVETICARVPTGLLSFLVSCFLFFFSFLFSCNFACFAVLSCPLRWHSNGLFFPSNNVVIILVFYLVS